MSNVSANEGNDAVFGKKTADRLNDVYRSIDVVERRMANFRMLDPADGECLLDVGCGPGMLSEELARAVGDHGVIYALDPSEAMRETARTRLEGLEQTKVIEGDAVALPLGDAELDGIVAVQVMEYVEDLQAALVEAKRVLKPGGRLVFGDIHYGSAIWHSRDPKRMKRFLDVWKHPVVHPNLVEHLPSALVEAGFVIERQHPLVMMTNRPKADSFPLVMAQMTRKPAIKMGAMSEREVDAFFAEQKELADKGAFFFSMTHFVTRARKP